ncbi:S8 family serine peptidase, partial [Kordia zhangzhouensis]|uniref:S8 family serine peptidase n=1 Tax=Kordia zhangzhouensis TaxID=1620405 RepID=UPI0006298FCB
KDIFEDSIAGISLEKAYREFRLDSKKSDTVIVAVLDMRFHINHPDLKGFIWKNIGEIPNNEIDDDYNGYIDDVHGWNFLGNKRGQQAYRANFEYVRIIRKYDSIFKNKNIDSINPKDSIKYKMYIDALKEYDAEKKYVLRRLRVLKYEKVKKNFLEQELSKMFPNKELTIEELSEINTEDELVEKRIKTLINYKKDSLKNEQNIALENRYLDIYLNIDFNERQIIGDNVDDITDTSYGNNIVLADNSENSHTHGIKVAGIIGADRNNNIGIKGITNRVKIMPVAISPYGDEQDKDIALGIRYAVNNGANIINISSSKSFSLNKKWVIEAIQYAEKNDVLVITSAGNEAKNLDVSQNYPNDTNEDNTEIVQNFLKVGATSYDAGENIIHYTSNYGKQSVDIFAPGREIFTTQSNNSYGYNSGTSYSAPIVSGIAALIRSYYPNLTAAEVKQIIM